MNTNNIRSFSYGIIFATIIFTIIYYFFPEEKKEVAPISDEEIHSYLNKNELKAVTEKEYEQLQLAKSKLADLEKQIAQKPKQPTDNQKKIENEVYQLKIKKGMTSTDIAKELEKAKIISSAEELNSYLINHDYHRFIQIGEYHVTKQMSFQEIAIIITKGKK